MPRRIKRTFIPIPPDRTTKWVCTIAGTDVSDFVLDGRFPWGLIGEELVCEIELDNSGEQFTNVFKENDEIIFTMDFTDGTTVQFKGEVEEIKSRVGNIFALGIKGAHFTSRLLDIMITEEFENAQISDIRTSLMTNLSDYTSINVEANTTTTSIKFINKPLFDCLAELDILGDEDSYIDHDKDLNSFKRNSKSNVVAHVTQDDSLIELRGLGVDNAEKRTKVVAYGEAGGLPVISTSEDANATRVKERVITDTSLVDESQTQEVADAEIERLKNPASQGSASTLFMLTLKPGDKIYIISNPHKIHDQFRVVKFVYHIPNETMEVFFNKERSIPKLFKDRIRKDQAQETVVNPFKMKQSFNFGSETGFSENKIDGTASNAIEVVDGKLKLVSGKESGDMISTEKDTPITVNSVHILSISEGAAANYFVNANGTNEWQAINLNTETSIDADKRGNQLRLRIELINANTKIPSVAVLYK